MPRKPTIEWYLTPEELEEPVDINYLQFGDVVTHLYSDFYYRVVNVDLEYQYVSIYCAQQDRLLIDVGISMIQLLPRTTLTNFDKNLLLTRVLFHNT